MHSPILLYIVIQASDTEFCSRERDIRPTWSLKSISHYKWRRMSQSQRRGRAKTCCHDFNVKRSQAFKYWLLNCWKLGNTILRTTLKPKHTLFLLVRPTKHARSRGCVASDEMWIMRPRTIGLQSILSVLHWIQVVVVNVSGCLMRRISPIVQPKSLIPWHDNLMWQIPYPTKYTYVGSMCGASRGVKTLRNIVTEASITKIAGQLR